MGLAHMRRFKLRHLAVARVSLLAISLVAYQDMELKKNSCLEYFSAVCYLRPRSFSFFTLNIACFFCLDT